MIKVFIPKEPQNPILHNTKHHDLPFHIEMEKFMIVDNVRDADVIPCVVPQDSPGYRMEDKLNYLGPLYKEKLIAVMFHTHTSETTPESFSENELRKWIPYTQNVVLVDLNKRNTLQIPYDFCWNRQKAYYVDYDKFDLTDRLWSGVSTKKMYQLDRIPKHTVQNTKHLKKFLLLGRTDKNRHDHPRNIYRLKLKNSVTKIKDIIYSNWDDDNLNILWPEERLSDNMIDLKNSFSGWWPAANIYYNNSFISLYVETLLTTNNKVCSVVTEKTFDPLIKGHFILPFGYQGLVEDIKDYGFRLPDWIDYSYDDIEDVEERFYKYLQCFSKLRALDIESLIDLHTKDRENILEYNRNLFFTKPYDSLYDKLKVRLLQP